LTDVPNRIVINNINLIDGTGAGVVAAQSVVISAGRISWVGPTGSFPRTEGATIIDGQRKTLLPGLINCHVHLCNDGAADLGKQVLDDSTTVAALRGNLNLELTLRSGVTTVRDCGAVDNVAIDLARSVESGLVVGPRILAAGRVITMTGGHGHFMGREADGPDAVRHATRAEIKEGAHFIKAMATGGVLTAGVSPDQTALGLSELEVIAIEAHNAGRRTACHAIGLNGIKNAVLAGIDSIEHGMHLDDEALQMMLDRGTYLVPTFLAVHQIVKNGKLGKVPAWITDKAVHAAEGQRESFLAAVRAGLNVAAGTDAGTPYNPHGDLSHELALMVDYGMRPMDGIVAATRRAAENLGIAEDVGTIEVGKRADLIMVDGDPEQDISALERVRFVMTKGSIVRDDRPSERGHAEAGSLEALR
jgi:imidazolonepropionase-like amidohydrolase